jgi:malate dehydrogenase
LGRRLTKISIIGAGNVGASTAQRLVEKGRADIVLLDIVEGLPQGKALDILESAALLDFDTRISGSNDYADTAGSDVVVITSGIARKPGMSREELLGINMKIVAEVTQRVVRYSPEAVIIVATNPVDAMTYLARRAGNLPRERVIGLSGALDGARLAAFVAAELGISVSSVTPAVMGEHGKNMVVLPRLTTVNGVPLTALLSPEVIANLVSRTVNGGAEIVGLLKTGSAFYAPSAALARMADAVTGDRQRIIYSSVCLEGEYGLRDTVLCVPVILGQRGVEKIVAVELLPQEAAQLAASAQAVRELIQSMNLK